MSPIKEVPQTNCVNCGQFQEELIRGCKGTVIEKKYDTNTFS
jgi:hypothetical protein